MLRYSKSDIDYRIANWKILCLTLDYFRLYAFVYKWGEHNLHANCGWIPGSFHWFWYTKCRIYQFTYHIREAHPVYYRWRPGLLWKFDEIYSGDFSKYNHHRRKQINFHSHPHPHAYHHCHWPTNNRWETACWLHHPKRHYSNRWDNSVNSKRKPTYNYEQWHANEWFNNNGRFGNKCILVTIWDNVWTIQSTNWSIYGQDDLFSLTFHRRPHNYGPTASRHLTKSPSI